MQADVVFASSMLMRADVTFCLLQQYLPDGADHPFAETMLKHFEKLNTPLRSVHEYPDLHSQKQRFFGLGYGKVEARNLWWLWSDPLFLSPSQRLALDKIEPFDEWEEFALFASHYILVTAQVGFEVSPRARGYSHTSSASDVSARTASPRRGENQLFGLTYVENIPAERGRAHHGAAFAVEGGVAIAYHGGVGPRARLGSTDVYGPPAFKIPTAKLPSASIFPGLATPLRLYTMAISSLWAAAHRLRLLCRIAGYRKAQTGKESKTFLHQDIAIPQCPLYYLEISLDLLCLAAKKTNARCTPTHSYGTCRRAGEALRCW